jgi:toxin ParE1/3/4
MYHVDVSLPALADLDAIADYLYSKNINAGNRILDNIESRIKSLETYPLRGYAKDDLFLGLRCLNEGHYRIFYNISDATVQILRVLHGKRDLESEF